jgi:hypothetical protein
MLACLRSLAKVDPECCQLFRIGDIAHDFDGANSYVDLVEEFGRDRGLYLRGRHVAILVASGRSGQISPAVPPVSTQELFPQDGSSHRLEFLEPTFRVFGEEAVWMRSCPGCRGNHREAPIARLRSPVWVEWER